MTKPRFPFRSSAQAALAVVFSVVLFSSCKKDVNNNNPGINTPVAGLMAFNLSPDKSAVGFSLSGSNLSNTPMSYTSYTGNYLAVYTGQRAVESFDFYTSGSIFASTPAQFDSSKYYSAFLIGTAGNYRNVVVRDSIESLSGTGGQSFIRFVNAITDSLSPANVTITPAAGSAINQAADFGNVSSFIPVAPGSVNIAIKNSNGIDVNRTIIAEQRRVYTVLLIGVPSSGATPVEIKYVTNGVLDSTATGTSAVAAPLPLK